MLYFQQPVLEKLSQRQITDNDLKNLALKYLKLCKQTREKTSENKNGVFYIENLSHVKKEIFLLQNTIDDKYANKKNVSSLSIKSSLFENAMSYTCIYGYYNPFTSEAQINPNVPFSQTPFTIAHELSHQLGYAREQEANFYAYLMLKNANNPDLLYSLQLYVLKSLLRNLSNSNSGFVENILSNYSEKMKKDRAYELEFLKNTDNVFVDVFGFTNDLFLKSNQQDGRVTYSYFVNLLVLYEK